jgi:hypothetical protein
MTAMTGARNVDQTQRLLESFPPAAWRESSYIERPPFVSEDIDGSVLVIPMAEESERILDGMRSSLGMKKVSGPPPYYITSRNDTIRAMRMFNWFLRRSWHNEEYNVLWTLIYEAGRRGNGSSVSISTQALADLTGYSLKQSADLLSKLFGKNGHHSAQNGINGTYSVDVQRVKRLIQESLAETPTYTEERIMHALCSETGASAAQLYDQLLPHDLTVGAVYKAAEKLKQDGYIHTLKHFRVNDRGPMRELLSSDCSNCFYGYSNSTVCFEDAFRRLERILSRYYGTNITEMQRANSSNAMRSLPQGPRVIRKVIEVLMHIQQVEALMKEKQVTNMLAKMQEWYGLRLPVMAENSSPESNIGSGRN